MNFGRGSIPWIIGRVGILFCFVIMPLVTLREKHKLREDTRFLDSLFPKLKEAADKHQFHKWDEIHKVVLREMEELWPKESSK